MPLELKSGTTQVEITDITAHLEPDSVILRDLKSGQNLRILEQNYRSDVASQSRLLSFYEGKTIEFLVPDKDGNRKLMPGKIIRSGYMPHYRRITHTISSTTRPTGLRELPATANRL